MTIDSWNMKEKEGGTPTTDAFALCVKAHHFMANYLARENGRINCGECQKYGFIHSIEYCNFIAMLMSFGYFARFAVDLNIQSQSSIQ